MQDAAEAPRQDDARGAAGGGQTYDAPPTEPATAEAKAQRRAQRAQNAEMEAAGRRWGWTPDRMDEPSELLKAQRRAERAERAEQLEHSSDAQQELRAAERCVSKAPTHTHTHPHTHTANGLGSLLPPRALANANGWRGRWKSLCCALKRPVQRWTEAVFVSVRIALPALTTLG